MEKAKEEYEMAVPHKCLCCGSDMGYGRSDRKFCSQNCKDRYNNIRRYRSMAVRAKVENALGRNYRILNDMLKAGVDQAPRSEIVSMGFAPEFLTSIVKAGKGCTVLACYDITYRLSESRIFNIQRMSVSLGHVNNLK